MAQLLYLLFLLVLILLIPIGNVLLQRQTRRETAPRDRRPSPSELEEARDDFNGGGAIYSNPMSMIMPGACHQQIVPVPMPRETLSSYLMPAPVTRGNSSSGRLSQSSAVNYISYPRVISFPHSASPSEELELNLLSSRTEVPPSAGSDRSIPLTPQSLRQLELDRPPSKDMMSDEITTWMRALDDLDHPREPVLTPTGLTPRPQSRLERSTSTNSATWAQAVSKPEAEVPKRPALARTRDYLRRVEPARVASEEAPRPEPIPLIRNNSGIIPIASPTRSDFQIARDTATPRISKSSDTSTARRDAPLRPELLSEYNIAPLRNIGNTALPRNIDSSSNVRSRTVQFEGAGQASSITTQAEYPTESLKRIQPRTVSELRRNQPLPPLPPLPNLDIENQSVALSRITEEEASLRVSSKATSPVTEQPTSRSQTPSNLLRSSFRSSKGSNRRSDATGDSKRSTRASGYFDSAIERPAEGQFRVSWVNTQARASKQSYQSAQSIYQLDSEMASSQDSPTRSSWTWTGMSRGSQSRVSQANRSTPEQEIPPVPALPPIESLRTNKHSSPETSSPDNASADYKLPSFGSFSSLNGSDIFASIS